MLTSPVEPVWAADQWYGTARWHSVLCHRAGSGLCASEAEPHCRAGCPASSSLLVLQTWYGTNKVYTFSFQGFFCFVLFLLHLISFCQCYTRFFTWVHTSHSIDCSLNPFPEQWLPNRDLATVDGHGRSVIKWFLHVMKCAWGCSKTNTLCIKNVVAEFFFYFLKPKMQKIVRNKMCVFLFWRKLQTLA